MQSTRHLDAFVMVSRTGAPLQNAIGLRRPTGAACPYHDAARMARLHTSHIGLAQGPAETRLYFAGGPEDFRPPPSTASTAAATITAVPTSDHISGRWLHTSQPSVIAQISDV